MEGEKSVKYRIIIKKRVPFMSLFFWSAWGLYSSDLIVALSAAVPRNWSLSNSMMLLFVACSAALTPCAFVIYSVCDNYRQADPKLATRWPKSFIILQLQRLADNTNTHNLCFCLLLLNKLKAFYSPSAILQTPCMHISITVEINNKSALSLSDSLAHCDWERPVRAECHNIGLSE